MVGVLIAIRETGWRSVWPNSGCNEARKSRRLKIGRYGPVIRIVFIDSSVNMVADISIVEETGYVVMCDRALPGERFLGRVTRKKNNYAEIRYLSLTTSFSARCSTKCFTDIYTRK
ncbi:hypothetical protein LXL04_037588 [Taraxacum kok-saghyz]